jgi:hypothetical protein
MQKRLILPISRLSWICFCIREISRCRKDILIRSLVTALADKAREIGKLKTNGLSGLCVN